MTLPEEIELRSKKEEKPGPGTYDLTHKPRLLGAYNLKDERAGFLEEA